MAEPSSTTAGGIAVATGFVTLTGSFLGLQYDALLFGLFGGLVSLMHVSVGTPRRMAGTLATAALLGAVLSQFTPALVHEFEMLKRVNSDHIRLATALFGGLFGQFGIPLVMGWLSRKSGGAV
jgi:hypothetical protein